MPRPLVSIIVINFNYAPFLKEAVASALEQAYTPVQVVVVDDGSTDESLTVLDGVSDLVELVSKSQGGHVSAFNAGFAASRGDVVIFLDADDKLYPNCVATVMAVWRAGLSKVQFRLDTIDAEGVDQHMVFPHYPENLNHAEIHRRLLRYGYYPWPVSSGNAFSRAFITQVTPIPLPRIFKSPDGYVNKMAPLFGQVEILNSVLGAYRVHGRNAWAQSDQRINLDTYSRTVRFDEILHDEFVSAAARFGHVVAGYKVQPVPQWVETRLLSLRLAPSKHPIAGDTVPKLLGLGLRSATVAPGITALGHLTWGAWFVALAVLPVSAVQYLLRRARAQSKRSLVARLLVLFSNRP
jgi:glycosyltransferase involved in cell wall biosynthesis